MLKLLRRMLGRSAAPTEPADLQRWAQDHGHEFRRARDVQGCVISGRQGTQAWRIEWGASQRSYIEGFELRLIADIGLPHDLMVMVLNRQLKQAMEKAVYDSFVDDVQTRIDTDTPAEMRWLVMFPSMPMNDMGRLRERYGAVSSSLPWLQQWLDSPLGEALASTIDGVPPDQAVVVTVVNGRLTMRTGMAQPEAGGVQLWFSVFEHALREARRLASEGQASATTGVPSVPSEEAPPATPPADAGARDELS